VKKVDIAGQVIGGRIASILLREKSGMKIELGDLLVVEEEAGNYLILHVYDLAYGSQIPQPMRELAAGLKLEGYGAKLDFLEPQLRNYVMAHTKVIAHVSKKRVKLPKVLPSFFSSVRFVKKEDLAFLVTPPNPVYVGKIRSGSKVLDVDVSLNGEEMLIHHVLIPATTGRGKSNLVKVMLWSMANRNRYGTLILDAHDEYYGRTSKGLKDHPKAKDNILYYTVNPPPGANTLVVNLGSLRPEHFEGLVNFSDTQRQAIRLYYREYHERWVEMVVRGTTLEHVKAVTLGVLQRIMRFNLSVSLEEDNIVCKNRVFSDTAGEATIPSIVDALEKGKIVIIDTSQIGDEAELLLGSIVATEILNRHQSAKAAGGLGDLKPIGVVIEEAPRVLGAEKLAEAGGNIYSKIAREGRKFKVGLVAISQLTSVIPRDILTNMNTKIILGNDMAAERRAIIESAAQDLSDDDRNIASLDRGEAIVSSIFTPFPIPVKIPLFDDYAKAVKRGEEKVIFTG
jgi:DNA helicase HerA-like ATPase